MDRKTLDKARAVRSQGCGKLRREREKPGAYQRDNDTSPT
jgi:hypothetical protein